MSDTTVRRPLEWETSADTNVGHVRQSNEDSILTRPDIGLWVVADGMGGYEVGDIASKMVVEALEKVDNKAHLNDIVNEIESAIGSANQEIFNYSESELNGRTIGSTVVSLVIRGRIGICMWVGDSRLYRYRNSELKQLSRDHSQVEELLQQGMIKPEEAQNHPDLNVITRAVGAESDVYIDINIFSTQAGDTFLLCSDGLYNTVELNELTEALSEQNLDQVTETLINKTLENGAPDNVSVVLTRGTIKKTSPVSNKQLELLAE